MAVATSKINTGVKTTAPKTAAAGTPSTYAWNATMGAPKNYDQWVSYHQQRGTYTADDAARQTAYRTYAGAHGLPTPWVPAAGAGPAAPVAPNFDALDPQGITSVADIQQQKANTAGQLADERNQRIAQIAADRINRELDWTNADRSAKNNAASRGMFNGGWRRLKMNQNLAALQQQMGLLDVAQTGAENAYTRGNAANISGSTLAEQTAKDDSRKRNMDIWYATRGM